MTLPSVVRPFAGAIVHWTNALIPLTLMKKGRGQLNGDEWLVIVFSYGTRVSRPQSRPRTINIDIRERDARL
ncbi:MAG: hypothetical protein ACT4NU_12995 [Chromatiales bacterium]